MDTKRNICKIEYQKGNIKNAYNFARKFDKIFSSEQIRILQIAYEILTGKESFYKSIDINTTQVLNNAKIILDEYCSN